MGTFNRITMPENFYDITSDMLLAQPEPQYLYAEMCLDALGASLQPPTEFGLPGRSVGGVGATYTPAEADRLRLANPISSQWCAANIDFKGMPGSTIRINRPTYTNSTYTAASRLIAGGSTISTTPVTVASQQTNLTLYRYGGPYDTAVQPYGIEAFDAQMGVHRAASVFGTHLKRDFHRFLDAVWVALLDLASTTVYPYGMSTDTDAVADGQFPFTLEQLIRTERTMDDANLPTFPDGFRLLVLAPSQCAALALDSNYQRLSQFHPELNVLFPNYVTSIHKFHIFKSTTLTSVTSTNTTVRYGHAIAPGVGMCGMGRPPRVMPNTNDNYGETILFLWLADLAFALANNAFVLSVRSGG